LLLLKQTRNQTFWGVVIGKISELLISGTDYIIQRASSILSKPPYGIRKGMIGVFILLGILYLNEKEVLFASEERPIRLQ
jgi:hypothetical protein